MTTRTPLQRALDTACASVGVTAAQLRADANRRGAHFAHCRERRIVIKLLAAHGLDPHQIAKAIGKSYRYVHWVINGRRKAKL